MAFFWFQKTGGEDAWLEATSDFRQKVIAETKPAFVTVLDAFSVPDETWGKEDYAKMKYSGPLYFDWDSDSIAETIPPFLEFLRKLEENGVNLKTLRLYATGGRGFHCEIPDGTFIPKPPKTGTALLPYIFKEMALELVVDTMDMRVYTGRKGRMWRTPGIVRSNGKYKVSISLDHALSMTPELYDELCAAPREEEPRELPEVSVYLASMFVKAQNKVDSQIKLRSKSKQDDEALARFSGEFPPTVMNLMGGLHVMPGVGFQRVAMQLAITANALGKSREDFVEQSKGLAQSHQGDSKRYNSPRKRKEELGRMWDYTHDNPCYSYSRGGIKSICAVGTPTPDIDGLNESAGLGNVPNTEDKDDGLPADAQGDVDSSLGTLMEGLMILKQGIFKRTADGVKCVSNASFRSPKKMVDVEDGLLIGIEAEVAADNVSAGRHLIPIQAFKSRASLNEYCFGRGAIFSGTDTQAGAIQLSLSRKAMKDGNTVYIVRKEGLDIIQNPTVRDKVSRDVVWVSTDGVMTRNNDILYRYQPKVSTSAMFNTDVHLAKKLDSTPETKAWLKAVFTMNSPVIVAQMLGWFVSCFHKQFYQAAYSQFPLLHPNGPAGSGKTLTTLLMARMFHLTSQPFMKSCSHNAASSFMLKSAWTSSASVPVILDEYKPSELGATRHDFLLQHFRLLYNQGAGGSGGINRGGAESSFRDITNYTYSAPTVYLGESQEMQTAIVQRSVPVAFNPRDSLANTAAFDAASAGAEFMPRLGALILPRALKETVESRMAALEPIRAELRRTLDKSVHDRQAYNLAVVLAGLQFLGEVLGEVFGDEMDPYLEMLTAAIYEHKGDISVSAMTEASKVLNDMSMISRTVEADSEFSIREGYEYIVGDGYVEIMMKEAFIKYFAWSNRKGFKPLYSSTDGFINSASKSQALMDHFCFDSKLRSNPMSKVFRFSLEKLTEEGVEPFKSKSLA